MDRGVFWKDDKKMRKLAREAIIFALLGLFLGTIGIFVYLEVDNRAAAKAKTAEAVHAGFDFHWVARNATEPAPPPPPGFAPVTLDMSKSQPIFPTVQVPLRNGTVLQVRQCPIDMISPDGKPGMIPVERVHDA